MITKIIVEDGRVGLQASVAAKIYASEKTETLNQRQAREILVSAGHKVEKCIENISVIVSNLNDDDHPFDNVWWFSVETEQEQKSKQTRTRRPRKQKDEQPQQRKQD